MSKQINSNNFSYFGKSKNGLWVKGVWDLVDGKIKFYWQGKQGFRDGRRIWYGLNNGDVLDESSTRRHQLDNGWVLDGEILVDDFFSRYRKYLTMDEIENLLKSIIVHIVTLVVIGIGDTVSSVVDSYIYIENLDFISFADRKYKVVLEYGDFIGAKGIVITVLGITEGKLQVEYLVVGEAVKDEIEGIKRIAEMISVTVPIV